LKKGNLLKNPEARLWVLMMDKKMPFKLLVPYQEALKLILKHIKPIERKEKVNIERLTGRVLAEDVQADVFVPPFNRAAMDGYAVRAEDTYGATSTKPKTLKLVEISSAGKPAKRMVGKGECIQVATGSPIPTGADAVVMLEFTEKVDEEVHVFKPVYPGANISLMGEDIKKGENILRNGDLLTPAKVGVLAALGRKEAYVYEKPRVAVVPTGTEIKEPGSLLEEGQIYDVNSYTLISVLNQNGSEPVRFPPVPDVFEELDKLVRSLVDYDMIVFSGGSSVGERDLLAQVIKESGEILFHGVQIKPGKPTLFGLIDGKPVFGMPGYPTSCLSNAYLLLVPAVRKMARLPPKPKRTVKARISQRVVLGSGREQFLTVKIQNGKAVPVFKESGAITSMAEADGYIVLPANLDVLEVGEEVEVILLE